MSKSFNNRLTIRMVSDPANLGKVRHKIENFAMSIGLNEDCQTQLVLAIDESITNIIRHAYENIKDQPISIEMTASDAELVVTVRDFGKVADPDTFKSRDIRELIPGGLGVTIMKNCMDCIDYSPAPGGGTILTMTKKLS